MAFDTAEPTCYRTNLPFANSGFFIHNSTRNVHYVHPRLLPDFPDWHQAFGTKPSTKVLGQGGH